MNRSIHRLVKSQWTTEGGLPDRFFSLSDPHAVKTFIRYEWASIATMGRFNCVVDIKCHDDNASRLELSTRERTIVVLNHNSSQSSVGPLVGACRFTVNI